MLRHTLKALALTIVSLLPASSSATTVSINTQSARAVLKALQNPALTHEEAMEIATMPGNQGINRKSNEFNIPATNQTFADALYAAAHGKTVTDQVERSYFFDMVKSKLVQ